MKNLLLIFSLVFALCTQTKAQSRVVVSTPRKVVVLRKPVAVIRPVVVAPVRRVVVKPAAVAVVRPAVRRRVVVRY